MSIELSIEEIKPILNEIRLKILRYLKKRKYTASELSRILDLSVPTVLYHLSILENSGYIKKVYTGRKWIYYELKELGHSILRKRILKLILLSSLATITALACVLLVILKKTVEHTKPLGSVIGFEMIAVSIILITITVYIIYRIVKR